MLREKANAEYKNRCLSTALRGYSLAILFGPVGESEISLAYANRSAVLFQLGHPTDALQDIEQALKGNQYPQHLQPKLRERKKKCEEMIGKSVSVLIDEKNVEIRKQLFSLKSPNAHIVSAEDCVQIDYSQYCGRKLVVSQEVPSGIRYSSIVVNSCIHLNFRYYHFFFLRNDFLLRMVLNYNLM
jgi:hypothetical protein